MPISPRTRAAYLRRFLRRLEEDRPRQESICAALPPAGAALLREQVERARAEAQDELDRLNEENRE